MLITIKASRKATQMRTASAWRRKLKQHRAYHLKRAEEMRVEADRVRYFIDTNEDAPNYVKEEAERTILQLQAQAIAEENGACMENHG